MSSSDPTPENQPSTSPTSSVPVSTSSFRAARPEIVGPDDAPAPPFPLAMCGAVQKGFGRGGKDLGCPTGACSYSTPSYCLLELGRIKETLTEHPMHCI